MAQKKDLSKREWLLELRKATKALNQSIDAYEQAQKDAGKLASLKRKLKS